MRSIEIPQPEDRNWRYRFFEILPGALSWTILCLPAVLTLISPLVAAYFIIAFLLFWFARITGLNLRSLQGWRNMNQYKKLPWQRLNEDLEVLEPHVKEAPAWHARNLERVRQNIPAPARLKPSQIYQAAIVAFYNESRDVLEPTIQSLVDSAYDSQKLILILAYEERGGKPTERLAESLIKEYGHHFLHAEAVKHPQDIEGEVIGKGGNITYAGRRLIEIVVARKIEPAHLLVTSLDSDNRPDKQYFAALTYTYCSTEEPKYASYQPIPMFTNNIWDAPAPMRVVATGNSFWYLVLSLRPHILRNFSAHAQPLSALIETDLWSTRTIVEDGHQYWRTFFRFDGKHDVFPIFVPVYQDAVLAATYWRTLKMQFRQISRWAWGASDIAYFAHNGFFKSNRVPKIKLIARFARLLENHISWATMPLILLFAGIIPLLIDPQTYTTQQLPQIARWIQTAATFGIFVSLYLSFRILPPKPLRYRRHRNAWMVVQWAFLPLTTIVYGAFAALYSQTRLMFGRYMGFVVTEKSVRKDEIRPLRKGVLRRIATRLAGRSASTP